MDWSVDVGDARNTPLRDGSAAAVITSPPYLNFVDYTKVYALELSLLLSSTKEFEELRRKSIRSHIGAEYSEEKTPKLESALSRVTRKTRDDKIPPIVEGYLGDLYMALDETERILEPGAAAVYVVGNATLPGVSVDVDLILAEMAEQIGFTAEDIWVGNVRWAGIHGIEKERPMRESAVILRKP